MDRFTIVMLLVLVKFIISREFQCILIAYVAAYLGTEAIGMFSVVAIK